MNEREARDKYNKACAALAGAAKEFVLAQGSSPVLSWKEPPFVCDAKWRMDTLHSSETEFVVAIELGVRLTEEVDWDFLSRLANEPR